MKTTLLTALVSSALTLICPGVLTIFTYTQTDSTTGGGTIQGFIYDDGGGPINFTSIAMPAANVYNPNPGLTPAGFIGAQTAPTGNSNEGNVATGLLWSGFVTATGTRGSSIYQMDIPLRYVPKQTQAPDINDYTWSLTWGDSAGMDVVGAFRFALYMSRDEVADSVETPDTFQRYTQQTNTFSAGVVDSFFNSDTTTAPIKDATDAGDPQGVDAAGRNLDAYWAWRDGASLGAGQAILLDDFTFSGLLDADPASLRLVPEPSAALLALGACGLFLRRRR